MKKLSLLFTFLFFASCNAPAENLKKKAGYLKSGDTKYDLYLGENSAVVIWDQYLDAHNNQDLEAIKALESEDLKIWGPEGQVVEGKDAHSEFLDAWFKSNNPKWDTYFSIPIKVDSDDQPGTWITSGHTLTLTIDGTEITTNDIADVYIEDGLIKMFYIYSRKLPEPAETE